MINYEALAISYLAGMGSWYIPGFFGRNGEFWDTTSGLLAYITFTWSVSVGLAIAFPETRTYLALLFWIVGALTIPIYQFIHENGLGPNFLIPLGIILITLFTAVFMLPPFVLTKKIMGA